MAREGVPQLTSDAQSDAWLSARQSVMILGLRSILCVPLQFKGNTIGVIYVDNRLQVGLFTPADLELLTAIAATAAVAIENARLYLLAVEKGRIERELQVARQVQASLLPRHNPQVEGWEFAAFWQPAREVAGASVVAWGNRPMANQDGRRGKREPDRASIKKKAAGGRPQAICGLASIHICHCCCCW